MTYTLKIRYGDEHEETKKIDYITLQTYSALEYMLHNGYWWRQDNKNWDFENIGMENPLPNFIINVTKVENE